MLRLRSSPNRIKPTPAIDMTPMIDMVFQLLIFFLLTSIFAARPIIDLMLPKAEHAAPETRGNEIHLVIRREGDLQIDGDRVAWKNLGPVLRRKIGDRGKTLFLSVDQEVPFSLFVEVLDIARALELSDLAIVTRRGKIPP